MTKSVCRSHFIDRTVCCCVTWRAAAAVFSEVRVWWLKFRNKLFNSLSSKLDVLCCAVCVLCRNKTLFVCLLLLRCGWIQRRRTVCAVDYQLCSTECNLTLSTPLPVRYWYWHLIAYFTRACGKHFHRCSQCRWVFQCGILQTHQWNAMFSLLHNARISALLILYFVQTEWRLINHIYVIRNVHSVHTCYACSAMPWQNQMMYVRTMCENFQLSNILFYFIFGWNSNHASIIESCHNSIDTHPFMGIEAFCGQPISHMQTPWKFRSNGFSGRASSIICRP